MSEKHDETQSLKTALKNAMTEKTFLEERLVWYNYIFFHYFHNVNCLLTPTI